MGRREKKREPFKFKIFSLFIWLFFVGLNVYFLITLNKLNMIPNKYMTFVAGTIATIVLLFGIIIITKKRGIKLLILLNLIMIIVLGVEVFASTKLSGLNNFLDENLNAKYETDIYYIVAKTDSNYNSLKDLSGKTIYYIPFDEKDEKLLERINNSIDEVVIKEEENVLTFFNNILKSNTYVGAINSGDYDSMIANDENIENNVKIIGTIEIKTEKQNITSNIDVTHETFAVLVNGIDTRSGKMPLKSLSDVNILIVVNPKDKKILMIHVPRDYYVEVYGKNGAKDKLTHTGIIGGINTTKATLENLFDIEIPYYLRVNFNAVIKTVDAIGGIDVYSDVNYSFHSYNLPALVINPGMNHLNGDEALAFAKERHAYLTGDRHRGENQEQVIKRIIEKTTSSKTLMTRFDSILESLSGTFETNMSSNEISALVKMEMEDMAKWTIEECNITGTDSEEYTYAYPNQKLYVMIPDQNSINAAKERLSDMGL